MSVQNGAYTRTNLGQGDGSNFPQFYLQSVQDHAASEMQGRAIFREEEWVNIIMPGNPTTRPVFKVNNEHRERWPKEYAAFKDGIELSPEGTPLEEWPILRKPQVLELKALGFKTVEHIRDMDDLAIQRIGMGGRILKERAIAFLDDAERIASNTKLSAENERLHAEVARLTSTVDQLGQRMESLFAEGQANKDALPAIATMIPGMHDPVSMAAQAAPRAPAAPSSLDGLAKRKGRAPMPRDAQGNIIRSA